MAWESLPSRKTPITPQNLLDFTYPIGSIYITTNGTDPQNIFGGKWERLKDRFLLACGDTYAFGLTGGEATHKLTVEEMPKHTHKGIIGYTNQPGYYGRLYLGSEGTNFDDQNYVGGDQAHNNMPPFLAVYMWKRIA